MEGSRYQYIALLRGINIGGHNLIKMAELRKLFESLGLSDVITYAQSGNVLFSTTYADSKQLTLQIEKELTSSIGKKINVFVLSPDQLKKAAANNPFDSEYLDKEHQCYLMFLSAEPDEAHYKTLMDLQVDYYYRLHIQDKVLYFAYSFKYIDKRRNMNFEKILGVTGTARSWKVVNKLIELSG